MVEAMTALVGIAVCIAILGAVIAALYGLIRSYIVCPGHLRTHRLTALTWTLITAIQTICLSDPEQRTNICANLLMLGAGVALVPSWTQLAERRRIESIAQKRRPFPVRLYSQTLWGPAALGAIVIAISIIGQQQFEQAVLDRDIVAAKRLREYRLGDPENPAMKAGLIQAVQAQDVQAVRVYLAIGVSRYWMDEALDYAFRKDSVEITETLLQYEGYEGVANRTWLLQRAVRYGNVTQVRSLLQYGPDRTARDYNGQTPLDIAKLQHNREMIKLLREPASEKRNNP